MNIDRIIPSNCCAKVIVIAILITEDGEDFISTNYCNNPQTICPREEGEDYTKCKEICKQPAHAEVNVINLAEEKSYGSTLFVFKHRDICNDCKEYAESKGVKKIIVVKQ